MTSLEIWLTIIGMAVITLFARTALYLLPARYQLPTNIQRGLRYAPACALMAIIVPDLLLTHGGPEAGTLDLSLDNARLIAGLIAAAAFLYKRDMLLTIVVGMVAFTVLRLI